METGEVGLVAELAQRCGAELQAAYKEALDSARRDLECENPDARAAARDFLERAAAREAIQRAQAGEYVLSGVHPKSETPS